MTHNEILAYLAGLVDGEGYIGIKKSPAYRAITGRVNPAYHERIQVRMVDRAGLDLLSKTLGGWLYTEKPHTRNGRPLWCYQASDQRAAEVCRTLLPYLRIKQQQAALLLRLRDEKAKPRKVAIRANVKNRWGRSTSAIRHRLAPTSLSYRESLYLQIKQLNHGGLVAMQWTEQSGSGIARASPRTTRKPI